MNCNEFRLAVGAQPGLEAPQIQEHALACAACARYRDEMRALDALIHRALKIDIQPSRRSIGWPVRGSKPLRLAASLAVAAVLGSLLWIARPQPSLAEQVVSHAQGEEDAIVRTSQRAAAADLAAVFAGTGVRLRPDAMHVSYAMSCWFRGHFVPHLVVQTARGPVTVLVLRHERSLAKSEVRQFAEGGFSGMLVAAPEGALAVLGRDASVQEAATEVLRALEYGTAEN